MEREGVIKFNLRYTPGASLPAQRLRVLDCWREQLYARGFIGCDPARYEGVGFGNVSERLDDGDAFVVTGSQTGHLPRLAPEHYTVVTAADVRSNSLWATGPAVPSSESLTHAIVYHARADIRFVFHVHSPVIWRQVDTLALPATPAQAAYGTPAMAAAIAQLVIAHAQARVFIMRGHEDGVIAIGATADEAGSLLLHTLERALAGV